MMKKYEKMKPTKKPNCSIYEVLDPFSEEEEEMMNFLKVIEEDGAYIEYDVRINEYGKHVYKIRKRDFELYMARKVKDS